MVRASIVQYTFHSPWNVLVYNFFYLNINRENQSTNWHWISWLKIAVWVRINIAHSQKTCSNLRAKLSSTLKAILVFYPTSKALQSRGAKTGLTKFCNPSHPYPTNFSAHNFLVPTLKLKKSKYRVSIRGPLLWNNILTAAEKTQESLPKFRTTIKGKLLSMTNEINYFWTGNIKVKNQFLSELNYSNSIILHSR